jgi:hypothetical protein
MPACTTAASTPARCASISRLGYMDYGVLEPADVFTLPRPLASDDGHVLPPPAEWDGKYR